MVDLTISDSVEAFSVSIVCFVGSFEVFDVGCLIEVGDSLLSEAVTLENSVSTGVNGVLSGSRDVSVIFCGVESSLDCAVDPVGEIESTFCSEDCPADFPVFASNLSISDFVAGVSVNDVVCFLGFFEVFDVGCLIEVADSLLSEVVALEDSVSTDENGVVVVYRNVVDTVPWCVVVTIVEPFDAVEVIADVVLVESAGSVGLANSDAFLLI